MGSVYEAQHTGTGRRVAIKLIKIAALSNKTLVIDDVHDKALVALEDDRVPRANNLVIDRFQREARAAGAIDTQHIAQVLDLGMDPATNTPYMVMELLVGEDLQKLLLRLGPLDPDLALRIIAQACIGLQKAHEAQVIHRDIKPANIFLAKRDADEHVVKLLDFGIAKMKVDLLNDEDASKLTATGSILGSPAYMSPEQVRGWKNIDHRSDIWSLGLVLYELLTGCRPFNDMVAFGSLVIAICFDEPKPIKELAPWVPLSVAAIVDRTLRKVLDERFETAQAMLHAIRALLPNGLTITDNQLVPRSEGEVLLVAERSANAMESAELEDPTLLRMGPRDIAPKKAPSLVLEAQIRPAQAPDVTAGTPLAKIQRMGTGETILLRSQMLMGRSAACDLRINEPRVSSEHARVRWTGAAWEVRDLGSKNGTFVGRSRSRLTWDPKVRDLDIKNDTFVRGRRLATHERATLIVGDAVGLGGVASPAPLFVLIDASAPVASVRSMKTGIVRLASGGMITLPDDENPEVCVVESRESKWTVEINDSVREASDGETLTIGDETWILDVPGVIMSTMAVETRLLQLESIELHFVTNLDQKDVALTVVGPDEMMRLPQQRHHIVLLALARERLRFAAAPPDECGWMDRAQLCRLLAINEQRLNVDVCSARREIAALGIQGAAYVVERHPATGALRLGVERVAVKDNRL